jgi:hypothetical protein
MSALGRIAHDLNDDALAQIVSGEPARAAIMLATVLAGMEAAQ